MNKNITHVTVGKSLPLFLFFIFCILVIIGLNFRTLVISSMEERVLSIAEMTKAGLTAHMKSGLMDKRDYFIREITNAPHVQSIQIIRTDAISDQFGAHCFVGEKRADTALNNILALKKPYYEMSEWSEKATMRAIVPYIASSRGDLNCLQCHHVPEETVLGAIDIELDVTEYRNKGRNYLFILFGVVLFFSILIAINTSRIIEQFVRKPLLDIIQLAKSVFFNTETQKITPFECKEFNEVALQFLQFGNELQKREIRMDETTHKFHSLNSEIDTTLRETLFAMGEAEETRSKETAHHTRRVVEYSRLLGELIGLSERDLDILVSATPLHDIGKIGIPDSILLKAGVLDENERIIINTHTLLGYNILKHSERDVLQSAAIIAYEHHEQWDGLGYPRGLKGENIHIFGRIVAIADVFDALGTARVYKEAWSLEKVKEYMKLESGKSFDPQLIDLMLLHYSEFEILYKKYYIDIQ